jgi:voltage-gated potassium channel
MVSFFFTVARLFKGMRGAWHSASFRGALLILVFILSSGTIFYSSVEGWSIVDALYFSVVTLATVGYGDLAPQTTAGKLFTIVYIFVGIGLFVAVATSVARGYLQLEKKLEQPDKDPDRK